MVVLCSGDGEKTHIKTMDFFFSLFLFPCESFTIPLKDSTFRLETVRATMSISTERRKATAEKEANENRRYFKTNGLRLTRMLLRQSS